MKIAGKINIEPMLFNDLKQGEVFYIVKECKNSTVERVYMKCGYHGRTDSWTAVNLENGICYSMNGNEPVQVVDAVLEFKKEN